MKRGQVTVFIILGIIILIVFLFAFFIVDQLSGKPMEEQELVVARSKLQSESLRYYVESCIRKATNEGLMRISNQGGFIFKGQAGSSISCTESTCTPGGALSIEGWKTPYLISKNPQCVHPQNYPYPKFPCSHNMSWPYCRYAYDPNTTVVPMLGVSHLPHLYKFQGGDSIQEQLETYISNKTDECIDFGGVTNITGIPYILQTQKPETNLSFTSYGLNVKVKLPMRITGKGAYPVVEVQDYDLSLPVRYGHFYSFVRDVLNKEIADPGFDIMDYRELDTHWPGFLLSVEQDRNTNGGDDLVIISDSESFIGQKQLEFRFIRQNLPPVLNYTRGTSHSNSSEFIEYMSSETQRLDVQPQAFDPNEDQVEYSYSGWGQDYFERYISPGNTQMLPIASNEKWMKSSYDQYSGAAYVVLNRSRDLGKHKFSIKAEDPNGLYDLQKINISVWNAATFTGSP